MLECNEVITVYHQVYDKDNRRNTYTATIIDGASWYAKQQAKLVEKGMQSADLFYVRIPLCNAPENFSLSKKDIVARGYIDVHNLSAAKIHEAYTDSFDVLSYSVNKRGNKHIHHIRISGS